MARSPAPVAARRALASGLVLLSALGPGRAAEAVAPHFDWRTLETPHFHVHYHEGTEEIARRVGPIAERALAALTRLLANVPETPIEIVISDETDGANGVTTVSPYNLIVLFPVVPEAFGSLDDYDDFLDLLVTHELTHVVHLDTIGGIARYYNDIFGKQLSPNQLEPRWFIEGLAVYCETRLTGGGRVRSALVDMIVREQVLAHTFPSLDEISTSTRRFPGGNFAYFLGGRFLDFIAARHGEAALARISLEYGSRIVPYGLNIVARHATGESFVELWDAWRREEEVATEALLARIGREGGPVEGRPVPLPTTEVYHPRFSATGDLVVLEAPRFDDAAIVVLAPDLKTERLRLRTSRGGAAFTPDGRRLVASLVDVAEEKYSFTDLEVIEIATGHRRRRTRGARVDEPDVSPDGRRIVAVAREGVRTRLVTLSVDGDDPPRPLSILPAGTDVDAPRWSPDGRAIVASIHLPGEGRRIAVFDAVSGARRDLTGPRAIDLDPVWADGGRTVLFSSDRGGVFNIHAIDVASGVIERRTNVTTGAFEPAVDPRGERLAFVFGTVDGYDLHTLDVAGPAAAARLPAQPTAVRPESTSALEVDASPPSRYSPWPTLLPRAWSPSFGVDSEGSTYGVLVSGQDAIGAHTYQLLAEYGTASQRFGYAFTYVNRQIYTPVAVSSSFTTTRRPGTFVPRNGDRLESIFSARTSVGIPIARWDSSQAFSLSYGIQTRRGVRLISRDPESSPPGPGQGDLDLASLSLGWSFSTVRAFADSISLAKGMALDVSIDINDPRLGSDYRVLAVGAHHEAFVTLPWARHHVLATRLALGGAAGDTPGRAVYSLGGLPARDVIRDYVDSIRFGADALRGYPQGALRGNSFYLGTAEYRLPIVDVERGVETLPAFFDRIYAAGFVDGGDAPIERLDLKTLHLGLGAELRIDVALGYYVPATVRFGFARGISAQGTSDVYLLMGGLF